MYLGVRFGALGFGVQRFRASRGLEFRMLGLQGFGV